MPDRPTIIQRRVVGIRSRETLHYGHKRSPIPGMCARHPQYLGLRRPAKHRKCVICLCIYAYHRAAGVIPTYAPRTRGDERRMVSDLWERLRAEQKAAGKPEWWRKSIVEEELRRKRGEA